MQYIARLSFKWFFGVVTSVCMILHKKIGILGGVSPESTAIYYKYITREYTRRYRNYGYPEMIIYSVSFQEFVDWQYQERWDLIADKMIEAFRALEKAGADFGLIAANTLHIVFDKVQREISIPLINIIEATAEAVKKEGIRNCRTFGHNIYHEQRLLQNRFGSKRNRDFGSGQAGSTVRQQSDL